MKQEFGRDTQICTRDACAPHLKTLNPMQTEVDILIIGAGPAGSSAAALLHKQGFKLLVVEKQIFPRFVIGESLLPHCMDLLQEADLLAAVEARQFIHKTGAV